MYQYNAQRQQFSLMALRATDDAGCSSTQRIETALEFFRVEGSSGSLREFVDVCIAGIHKSLIGLRTALGAGETDLARHHTHSIKNEFAIVGYDEGVAICEDLSTDLRTIRGPLTADLGDLERAIAVLVARLSADSAG